MAVLVMNNSIVVVPLLSILVLLKTVWCIMNGGRFKTEISHSVTQSHPSFLFFKVYFTYKFFFGSDQINFCFRSISNCGKQNEMFYNFSLLIPYQSLTQVVAIKTKLYKSVRQASRTNY